MTRAHGCPNHVQAAALAYLQKGWSPIPVPPQEKSPNRKGWQNERLAEDDVERRFHDPSLNIGILLGEPSSGLVDVDLDCPEALALAPYFLPETGMVFGRESKPQSHHIYIANTLMQAQRFQFGKKTLVEFRSSAQTLFPPSTHPCGEIVRFDTKGEPAKVAGAELATDVAQLAAACLITRHWPRESGARHAIALALAGTLLRAGWSEAVARRFIRAVAETAGDEEVADRIEAVPSTAKRLEKGEAATGIPSLAELLGEKVVSTLQGWLALRNAESPLGAKMDRQPVFKLYRIEELDNLPEPQWLIEGVATVNALIELYGKEGTAKTFLALDWALSVAAGLCWQGRQVSQGDVVYVYAEGRGSLKKRIAAWRAKHLDADPSRFKALPQPVNFLSRNEIKALIKAIGNGASDPVLVVIDTVARCFGGADENSTKDMNSFVASCDSIRFAFERATVMVVHHAGKEASRGGRGSTALRGAVDAVLKVEKTDMIITLECEKQRDWEPFEKIPFLLEKIEFDDGETSCVIAGGTKLDPPAKPLENQNDRKALEALRKFGTDGATFTEWNNASGVKPSTFKRRIVKLNKRGAVWHEGDRYWVAD